MSERPIRRGFAARPADPDALRGLRRVLELRARVIHLVNPT